MRNKKHDALQLTLTAAAALTSGQTLVVGNSVGIVGDDAAIGDSYVLHLAGVYEVVKNATLAWTAGAKVYFHTTNLNWTTSITGAVDVGAVAGEAASSAAVLGVVVLGGGSTR